MKREGSIAARESLITPACTTCGSLAVFENTDTRRWDCCNCRGPCEIKMRLLRIHAPLTEDGPVANARPV
jgi:hypothetical protein